MRLIILLIVALNAGAASGIDWPTVSLTPVTGGLNQPTAIADSRDCSDRLFSTDGYLYVGTGDGGSENDPQNYAQNPQSLLGKMLRIDVESSMTSYCIPATNPFRTNLLFRPEIWALGLRNPWRFSFDKLTGD